MAASRMQAVVEGTAQEDFTTAWRVLSSLVEAANEMVGEDYRAIVGAQRFIANIMAVKAVRGV